MQMLKQNTTNRSFRSESKWAPLSLLFKKKKKKSETQVFAFCNMVYMLFIIKAFVILFLNQPVFLFRLWFLLNFFFLNVGPVFH